VLESVVAVVILSVATDVSVFMVSSLAFIMAGGFIFLWVSQTDGILGGGIEIALLFAASMS
jgi:hypothetical protein